MLSPAVLLSLIAACFANTGVGKAEPQTLREAAARHRMIIGTAADAVHLKENDYATTLSGEFSQLQAENEMKFDALHPRPDTDPNPYNFGPADQLVEFAQSHKMLVRGHTLMWHSQVARWVTGGHYTPDQLSTILKGHIDTVMKHYAGKVYAWDVVNEAFNDDGALRSTIWYNRPGIGLADQGTKTIEQAFRWAHDADPKAQLFYNDYGIETLGKKSDAVYAMLKDFRARGVPVYGIGFQCHFDLSFDNPGALNSFEQNLKRFAGLGLKLHITELDVRLKDSSDASLQAQAKLYGELAGICVKQRACKLFQIWGFTDKYSWIPGFTRGAAGWALPFDDHYQKKPAYQAIFDAFK